MKKIKIYDTTLRDGMQGADISYSLENKLSIVRALDSLGISFIEVGNAFYNPGDAAFFRRIRELDLKNAKIVSFCSTVHKGLSPEEDRCIGGTLDTGASAVAIVGKSWDMQVCDVLMTSPEENLRMIKDTVRFFREKGKEVFFDAEHFFSGYAGNKEYAVKTVLAAEEAGADAVVLCDTNGGTFPDEIYRITKEISGLLKVKTGIHCHNDAGCADANALMAVKAGAEIVQGTLLGFGERCGNTALSTTVPNLELKAGYECISAKNLKNLTKTVEYVAEQSNIIPDGTKPYVGRNAFAHKGGMHIDGVIKNSASFEHEFPESVGNKRRILISELSGKSAAMQIMERIGKSDADSVKVQKLSEKLKELENAGYQFESANASLELLAMKTVGEYSPTFELIRYNVTEGMTQLEGCAQSVAMIKIKVGEREEITADAGDGPVNALDRALRKALEVFYPTIKSVRLSDYKVRVLSPGEATAAQVRVVIDSTDGENVWTTVGVSKNIIEASWLALVDSFEYKLLRIK